MPTGVVLVTCIPPTIGHGQLIKYASEYMNMIGTVTDRGKVKVFLNTRPHEPMNFERIKALQEYCQKFPNCEVIFNCCDMPQYPKGDDDPDFWARWLSEIQLKCGRYTYLFSSEDYGQKLVDSGVGRTHVPVDIHRTFGTSKAQSVSASSVRINPIDKWYWILPEFRKYVSKTVTIFGSESTGKSTMAKHLGDHFDIGHLTEWARPYLEQFSNPETNQKRMNEIVRGQYVLQKTMTGKFCQIRDTDLLTTIGYYRTYFKKGYRNMPGYEECLRLFEQTRADLYLMMPSDIPYEPDALRYGGTKRDTTDQFWIELLTEFGCKFETIQRPQKWEKNVLAEYLVHNLFSDQPIFKFHRERPDDSGT